MRLLFRYEQLKHIAGDYKKREQELEGSLKSVRAERKELAQKYDELHTYLKKNAHLLSEVNTMESNVVRIKSLILIIKAKLKNMQLLDFHFIIFNIL